MLYKEFRVAVSGCSWQVSYFQDGKKLFPKYILIILEDLLFWFHDSLFTRKPYGQKIRVPSLQDYPKDHFQK